MLDLSSVARERAVLATVANAIVAAAAGRGLQVAVACPDAHLALVDHLAQALHARGRACHCQISKSNPSSAAGVRSRGDENGSALMVLTSGPSGQTDDVQRVNIRVTGNAPPALGGAVTHQRAGEPHADADHEPDILLDYHDPDGPTIRHIAPHLSPPPGTPTSSTPAAPTSQPPAP
ncbi:hypothetical protein NCC78_19460 [Micromonospora phytophila]|uniref:hypothetical protein n=1 Tax=Micromonospora phytophila TaxID=709888 RepID=UPI00202E6DE4|nr:hypothetical protein [Micromonospora phytophila]MCM0676846.1 hypothetical protein [Micromonospora phytophila]